MKLRFFLVLILGFATPVLADAKPMGDTSSQGPAWSDASAFEAEVAGLSDAAEINLLKSMLLEKAALAEMEINDLDVKQSIGRAAQGTLSSSCTATATVNLAGVGSVTLSATAPTCAEAVNMLMDYIDTLIRMAEP